MNSKIKKMKYPVPEVCLTFFALLLAFVLLNTSRLERNTKTGFKAVAKPLEQHDNNSCHQVHPMAAWHLSIKERCADGNRMSMKAK